MNIAVITGASSGMGREFARQIAQNDKDWGGLDELWIIARRIERLDELKKELKIKSVIFSLDLSDADSINILEDELNKVKPNVRVLVNCAGYGLIGNFTELTQAGQSGMIKVNCLALTQITYAVLPYMSENSKIIQLASSAAFLPQPRFSVYAATKAYVLSFSRSLNNELINRKITVTAVCPGPVKTEFFDIAEKTGDIAMYKKLFMADCTQVVADSIKSAKKGKDIFVPRNTIKAFHMLTKILPHKFIMKFIK